MSSSVIDPVLPPAGLSYVADPFQPYRRPTRVVMVGTVGVGGDHPIRLQSMTTTRTQDVEATTAQALRLVEAGCEIVRITAPTVADARAIGEVRARLRAMGYSTPLVADIHFSPAAALAAAEHADKVRVNPGNFADSRRFAVREYTDDQYGEELERVAARFTPVVVACRERGVALRIGTNHGSLSDRVMNRFGDTPEGMVESALEFVRICEGLHFHQIILSMKASNPKVMIAAYRLLVARMDAEGMAYPLHLGVTEAGNGDDARIKSATGIGSLLLDGLGDTIRVSLAEEPEAEIPVARHIVALCGRPPLAADGAPGSTFTSSPNAAPGTNAAKAAPVPGEQMPVLPYDPFHYRRRPTLPVDLGAVRLGAEAPIAVAAQIPHQPKTPDAPDTPHALETPHAPDTPHALETPDAPETPGFSPGSLTPRQAPGFSPGAAAFTISHHASGNATSTTSRHAPGDATAPLALASDPTTGLAVFRPRERPDLLIYDLRPGDDPALLRRLSWKGAGPAPRALVARSAHLDLLREALPAVEAVRLVLDGSQDRDTILALARDGLATGTAIWLEMTLEDAPEERIAALVALALLCRAGGTARLLLSLGAPDAAMLVRGNRLLAALLAEAGLPCPIVLQTPDTGDPMLAGAAALGSLLCDGIGDAAQAASVPLTFDLLQGAGARLTRTDYVACPSCGRTLFDLQSTTERIKAGTSHLQGVKIAIMGCVVNGPGEMADADFGYMGGSPGHVNLYVGKECVERNVPEAEADSKLIDLIRAHGRWMEPDAMGVTP